MSGRRPGADTRQDELCGLLLDGGLQRGQGRLAELLSEFVYFDFGVGIFAIGEGLDLRLEIGTARSGRYQRVRAMWEWRGMRTPC